MLSSAVTVRRLALSIAAVALASGPSVAAASEPVIERGPPPPETVTTTARELEEKPILVGDVDVGIFAERTPELDIASVSPLMRLGIRPRPNVEILAGLGAVASFSNGPEGKQTLARPSNLGFGVHWVGDFGGDKYRAARVGFQFAIPTGAVRSEEEAQAYRYALGGRGGWNPWDWAPATLGLVIPAEVQAQVWRRLVVGGEAAVGGLFASIDNEAPHTAAAQVAASMRWVLPWFAAGLRISGVVDGRQADDNTQAAVTPFADVSLCRKNTGRRLRGTFERTTADCPVYASARFNVNLDAPYGFIADDAMRVWGLQVGLGWAVF